MRRPRRRPTRPRSPPIEQAEAGAVRVPYMPEIVKQEIRTQVAEDLKREVTAEVIETAKTEDWAIPGALPDWIKRMRFTGDMRAARPERHVRGRQRHRLVPRFPDRQRQGRHRPRRSGRA